MNDKKPTRADAIRVALNNSAPAVSYEDVNLLDSPEFKRGWELATKALTEKIEFALTGNLKTVRRHMRTWALK